MNKCRNGHDLNEENLRFNKYGHRRCKACTNESSRKFRRINRPTISIMAGNRDRYLFGGNREAAIERDGGKCVVCGINRQEHRARYNRDITVDHIDGQGSHSARKNNKLENLQTLCVKCHGKKDGKRTGTVSTQQVSLYEELRELSIDDPTVYAFLKTQYISKADDLNTAIQLIKQLAKEKQIYMNDAIRANELRVPDKFISKEMRDE